LPPRRVITTGCKAFPEAMSEINFAPPAPPPGPPSGSGGGTQPQVFRALASLEVLRLQPGQQMQAEVRQRAPGAEGSQLNLRVALADGRSLTLDVAAGRQAEPAVGARLQLTVLPGNRLLATPLQPASPAAPAAPLTRLDLPAGTLLQARVLSSTPLGGQFQVLAQLPDGRQMLLSSAHPLPVGSLLNARVLDDRSLHFISPDARVQQLELLQQLSNQFAQQSPLSALFRALRAMQGQPLPPNLAQSIERLLGNLPSAAQVSDPRQLAAILRNAGIGLENRLLTGQTDGLSSDLKANLLRLLGQLAGSQQSTGLS